MFVSGNKPSPPPRGVSWITLTGLCKPLMMYTTQNIRTSPRYGIPEPAPGARPGDRAQMRASGGRSNKGTRRSTGTNPKKLRGPITRHQQLTSDSPPTFLDDMRGRRGASTAHSVESNIGIDSINTT